MRSRIKFLFSFLLIAVFVTGCSESTKPISSEAPKGPVVSGSQTPKTVRGKVRKPKDMGQLLGPEAAVE